MHRILFYLRTWLAVVVMSSVLSGCNSLQDAWDNRGVPPQSEPDE